MATTTSRTMIWPAKSTPSSVASNGPTTKRTVSPARVKTDTRATDTATGRLISKANRMSLGRTPATIAAGTTPTTRMASGPT